MFNITKIIIIIVIIIIIIIIIVIIIIVIVIIIIIINIIIVIITIVFYYRYCYVVIIIIKKTALYKCNDTDFCVYCYDYCNFIWQFKLVFHLSYILIDCKHGWLMQLTS